jgi:hypothetical protein
MKELTFYEQVGILIPGAILVFSLTLLFSGWGKIFGSDGITVGGLGLFLIIAYGAGHAVAAVGNGLERLFWAAFGGMPSEWFVSRRPKLALSNEQVERVRGRIMERFRYQAPQVQELSRTNWRPIFAQIYRDVLSCNPGRVEVFNGNYGLNRGLAAAFVADTAIILIVRPTNAIVIAAGTFAFAVLFLYRMHRFGVHFAREVYYCFMNPAADSGE